MHIISALYHRTRTIFSFSSSFPARGRILWRSRFNVSAAGSAYQLTHVLSR